MLENLKQYVSWRCKLLSIFHRVIFKSCFLLVSNTLRLNDFAFCSFKLKQDKMFSFQELIKTVMGSHYGKARQKKDDHICGDLLDF